MYHAPEKRLSSELHASTPVLNTNLDAKSRIGSLCLFEKSIKGVKQYLLVAFLKERRYNEQLSARIEDIFNRRCAGRSGSVESKGAIFKQGYLDIK